MRRKKINPNDEGTRVDFVDESGDSWQEFPILHPKFKDWLIQYRASENVGNYTQEVLQKYFEQSPWYDSTANDINWEKRNEMQAILQKYTTNAISSTINLPSTVTEQEVSDIYLSGWKLGLKGQTVYVDGSRSGVLVSDSNETSDSFEYKDAPKRPKVLPGEAHVTKIKNVPYTVTIGLLDNKPYEIFISPSIIKGEGVIIKQKKGEYDFVQVNDSNSTHRVLTDDMTDEQAAITRLVSTSLRHGADIKFIVEQLNKTPGDMFGFTKGLARVLKKYIPEGSKSTVSCNDCGSSNVIFEEGCHKCLSCGSSKCG